MARAEVRYAAVAAEAAAALSPQEALDTTARRANPPGHLGCRLGKRPTNSLPPRADGRRRRHPQPLGKPLAPDLAEGSDQGVDDGAVGVGGGSQTHVDTLEATRQPIGQHPVVQDRHRLALPSRRARAQSGRRRDHDPPQKKLTYPQILPSDMKVSVTNITRANFTRMN